MECKANLWSRNRARKGLRTKIGRVQTSLKKSQSNFALFSQCQAERDEERLQEERKGIHFVVCWFVSRFSVTTHPRPSVSSQRVTANPKNIPPGKKGLWSIPVDLKKGIHNDGLQVI